MKNKSDIRAEFCRAGTPHIAVFLSREGQTVYLFRGLIEHGCRKLSEAELEEVIDILTFKKRKMLKRCDFPAIYDDMLSDLIEVYRKRYVKRGKKLNKYSLSVWQLEELIEQRYNFKEVHIDSIYAGSNKGNAAKIEVGSPDRVLYVSFSEEIEDD